MTVQIVVPKVVFVESNVGHPVSTTKDNEITPLALRICYPFRMVNNNKYSDKTAPIVCII
jgi:hypothetical protein